MQHQNNYYIYRGLPVCRLLKYGVSRQQGSTMLFIAIHTVFLFPKVARELFRPCMIKITLWSDQNNALKSR